MRILGACRDICVQYLKTFDDIEYWKNIVRRADKTEKSAKTDRALNSSKSTDVMMRTMDVN